jgi:hypothetical protein
MKPLPPVIDMAQETSVPTPAVSGAHTDMESGTKKFAITLTGPLMLIVLGVTLQLGLHE